ncbi:Yos1-like protein [Gautieria morchelliformis]|nr:Yos1-like protein [Gautieria morchelliformis]
MAFSIGNILYISLLLVNAIAVLSEERFLARIGWSTQQPQAGQQGFAQPYDAGYGSAGGAQGDLTVKMKLVNLIGAVRTLMRIPLIGVNLVVIVYELVLG